MGKWQVWPNGQAGVPICHHNNRQICRQCLGLSSSVCKFAFNYTCTAERLWDSYWRAQCAWIGKFKFIHSVSFRLHFWKMFSYHANFAQIELNCPFILLCDILGSVWTPNHKTVETSWSFAYITSNLAALSALYPLLAIKIRRRNTSSTPGSRMANNMGEYS